MKISKNKKENIWDEPIFKERRSFNFKWRKYRINKLDSYKILFIIDNNHYKT
jgi:hypothetical protein